MPLATLRSTALRFGAMPPARRKPAPDAPAEPVSSAVREDAMLTPQQAADYLATTVHHLEKMRVERRGPTYVRLGSKLVRYRRSDLDDYIEANRREAEK